MHWYDLSFWMLIFFIEVGLCIHAVYMVVVLLTNQPWKLGETWVTTYLRDIGYNYFSMI